MEWFFTPVFASPVEELRNGLWTYLRAIANRSSRHWLVVGDFNHIVSQSDKKD